MNRTAENRAGATRKAASVDVGAKRPPEAVRFTAGGSINLARVWRDLRSGRVEVVGATSVGEAHYLWLQEPKTKAVRSERVMDTLELVLTDGTKQTAIATDSASSTIALQVATALSDLGMPTRHSRLPMIVGLAVLAHRRDVRLSAEIQRKPGAMVLRYMVHPSLKELLPASEYAVILALLTGATYLEIATARGTSARTVANQIAAVFRRLGVSGRMDLLRWVAERHAVQPTPTSKVSTNPAGAPRSDDLMRADLVALKKRVALLERQLKVAKARPEQAGGDE